ncbi:MAG: molybdopterin-dependent oxidoreductase [Oligoflexales bacterium]
MEYRDNWQLPLEPKGKMRIQPPANYAGGMGSICSATKFLAQTRGLLQAGRGILRMNQNLGFDCPGCAWPEPLDKRSTAEFCENGAKAFAEEATAKSIGRSFFESHDISELAKKSDYWLGQQGRIAEPIFKENGDSHYRGISWDEAIEKITNQLKLLSDPNEAVFYTSGRTSNEAAFLYQLLVRCLGTNNLPDCSNMCHESSGVAMTEAIGIGKGSVRLEDFDEADLIFVVGQNPGTNHPRMLSALQRAKRKGCQIVVINPIKEAGSQGFIHPQEVLSTMMGLPTLLMDIFIPVKPGGDFALFRGINKGLLENPGFIDKSFVQEYTEGFEGYKSVVKETAWDDITKGCNISREKINELVSLVGKSKRIICCWAMGLTQQVYAVQQIKEVLHFLMLRGNLGHKGAGACPVRGHSNVQGDRTMGIWEKPSSVFLKKLSDRYRIDFILIKLPSSSLPITSPPSS